MEGAEECTARCRSKQHGDQLSAIIMSPMLTDAEVAAYLPLKCNNYPCIRNSAGQSLGHVAAAAGRLDLLRLLLHLREFLNEFEEESNYTPLHLSLLHGEVHCAVRLMQLGSNANIKDKEHLTPVDIVMKDKLRFQSSSGQELYVWGSNTNYNLGCGHNRERALPEPHDFFRKAKISINQAGMEKFHSVFKAVDGSVWGCGLGVRAGLGVETAALEPRQLVLPEAMTAVSVGEQHTLLLSKSGTAYSCGLNTHSALGLPQLMPSLAVPKPIRGLPSLKGVCAAYFHSVFYSETQLFTCGTNKGQLGHSLSGEAVVVPREVTAIKIQGTTIKCVAASEGATVLLNSDGAVYLLSGFRCSRLTPRSWLLKSERVFVIGGPDTGIELRVGLLTVNNLLYIWRKSTEEFLPCVYSVRRQLRPNALALTATGCLFTTCDGEAFHALFKDANNKIKKVEEMDVRRIAHIHRGAGVATDSRARNFAVLQYNPHAFASSRLETSGTEIEASLRRDLGILLDETNEDDNIHDVTFLVGGRSFFAHSYIIFHSNENTAMKKLLAEYKDQGLTGHFELADLPVDAFNTVLRFVYTLQCPISSSNNKTSSSQEDETVSAYAAYQKNGINVKEIAELRFVARRLGVTGLVSALDNRPFQQDGLVRKAGLHDIVLIAEDATRVRAHKCVLVARLEFFRVMLTHGWRESVETELRVPLSGRVLEVLVEFLYLDRSAELEACEDIDFLSLVLVSADQLLCEGLKHCAGQAVARIMSLRNAPDILQLASTCHAPHLMSYAQKFILANLAAFLESRSLEILPDNRLQELSVIYKSRLPHRRRLKSSLDAMEVVMARSLAEAFPVTLDGEMEVAKPTKKRQEKKISERQRRVSGDSGEEMAPTSPKPKKIVNSSVHTKSSSQIASPPAPDVVLNTSPVIAKSPSQNASPKLPADAMKASNRVQTRLKVISENVHSSPPTENLTLLIKKTAAVSIDDFPSLHGGRSEKTPAKHSPVELPKKFTKLSQRERRRLASVSSTEGEASPSSPTMPITSPPRSAWAPLPSLDHQLPNSPEMPTQMEAIIDAERADRERAARMRSKPLVLTQIEDRALRELEIFYNAAEATEERITVRRLVAPGAVAPPVWPVTRWR